MKYFVADRKTNEPAYSLIERSAGLNSCDDSGQLLDDLMIDRRKLRMGDSATIHRISELFNISIDEALEDTPVLNSAKRSWQINGEVMDEQHLRLRFPKHCPICCAQPENVQDAVSILGCIPVITACVLHNVLLTGWSESLVTKVGSSFASQYFSRRLGLATKPSEPALFLDRMTWRAAARATRIIGTRLLDQEKNKDPAQLELHEIMEIGFAALQSENTLSGALDAIIDKTPAGKEIGETRAYGPRILSLRDNSMAAEAKPFITILAKHSADHIPVREVSDTGDCVRTIVSVAQSLNVHPKTLGLIVKGCEQPKFYNRHRLISKPLLAELRLRLAETTNQKKMFEQFGLGIVPGKELAKLKIVKPLYPCEYHKRTYSTFDMRQVVLRLAKDAPVLDSCPSHLASVPNCADKIRRSVSAIFKLINDDQIPVLARGPELRFDHLFVDPARVRAALFGETVSAGIPRRAAERLLKTTGRVVDALIDVGLIEAVTEESPIPRSRRVVVLEDSIRSFKGHFIMSLEIIDRTGMSFKHFKRDLAEQGLKPLDLPTVPATIFERAPFELLVQQGLIATRASPFSQT